MARGFESKDVEYQQAEATRHRSLSPELTVAERQALDRRRTLELSLIRMRSELLVATLPAHRRTLEAAIRTLESDLLALLSR